MSSIPDEGTVNYKVNSFLKKLSEIYDSCCPIRSKTISYKRFMRPWIDNQLIAAINHKHALYRDYKQGIVSYFTYNAYKKACDELMKNSKTEYIKRKFSTCAGVIRKQHGNKLMK